MGGGTDSPLLPLRGSRFDRHTLGWPPAALCGTLKRVDSAAQAVPFRNQDSENLFNWHTVNDPSIMYRREATSPPSDAYIFIPQSGIGFYERGHESDTFSVLEHVDQNSVTPEILLGANEGLVFTHDNARNLV